MKCEMIALNKESVTSLLKQYIEYCNMCAMLKQVPDTEDFVNRYFKTVGG